MTADTLPLFTRLGLRGIDRIPFGIHACHFYRDRDQLIAALIPYFTAGLDGNECCLWITASPLPAREAIQALRDKWDGAEDAIHTGALRILDIDHWYANWAQPIDLEVVDVWLREEERAIAEGYSGLRIAGNVTFLKPDEWPAFMEYERAISERFNGRRIVALCSYAVSQCSDQQISEITNAHHCALERPDAAWQVVAAAGVSTGPRAGARKQRSAPRPRSRK